MRLELCRAAAALLLVVACASATYAQSGSISGTVTDGSGAVLPGADVLVKNNATAAESRAATNSEGGFTVPSLNAGNYTVTVSLQGFKTVVLPDVQVITATPASVRVVLELGQLAETVTVVSSTDVVQTQTAAVQTTIAVKQIESLPLVTRTALDYVTALPGALTTGSNSRGTTINGLPSVSINITLDGVNVQDNNNRNGDGFFMYIRPLLDSVEEITVSTSTPGAESSGQGAAQIRMTTRAGSNRFAGSVYDTWRNQGGVSEDDVNTRSSKRGWLWRLNTPYWFNKRDRPRTPAGDYFIDDVRLETPGFRVGGPILPDRLFYFFNWEWFKWPNQVARTRYLTNANAQRGLFTYTANDGSRRTIDLLGLAASRGQTSTIDPTMSRLFGDIRSAAEGHTTGGSISSWDLNTDKFDYSPGGDQFRHFPTARIDYNVTPNHQLTATARYNRFESDPDILNSREPRFPGFANVAGQYSHRYMWSGTLRSTLGKNWVNEARYGFSGGTTQFFTNVTRQQFDCSDPGCQGGWNLATGNGSTMLAIGGGGQSLTGATNTTSPSTRYVPDAVYEDTLTWLKGKHTVAMGGSFTSIRFENWDVPGGLVPGITFGVSSNDPMFSVLGEASGNYPGGINATQAGFARNLYALLTGRVTQVAGTFVLDNDGNYQFLGERWQKGRQNEIGLYISDSWRMTPRLTVTGGLRYELQLPFEPDLTSFSRLEDWTQVYGVTGPGNLFKPGTMTGSRPVFVSYEKGDSAYTVDRNNLAPSIGVAWRPQLNNRVLSSILSSEPVIRGGYSISYDRYGTGDFTGVFGNNPGATRAGTRSIALGTLGTDGLPVLLREASRLGPPTAPVLTYPFNPATNEQVRVMDPTLRVPYTHQYSIGWQRELGRDMAVEIRYIGNQNIGGWTTTNLNAGANWNILENGFYDEFRLAQKNLQANIADRRGNTFAYTGAPGTAPLPIFLAYFAGVPLRDARNQNPSNYTNANFASSAWYNLLAMYHVANTPAIITMAGTGTNGLQNTAFAANATRAGLPANFFMVNPSVFQTSSNLLENGGTTRYDALQIELRRRFSQGLSVQGSYNWGARNTWNRPSLRSDFLSVPSTVGPDHAVKINWVYELPFGRDRAFGRGAAGWLNAVIGGWEFDGMARMQSGTKINFGGRRLVGMTEKELQDMFKFYRVRDSNGIERVYMLPQDVIENSRIALSEWSSTSATGYTSTVPSGRYLAPANGPDCVEFFDGQCSPITTILTAPWYGKFDFGFAKRFSIGGRRIIEARMDLYNVFDNINFTPVGVGGSALSSWEVTSAARDLNASQDAGGRVTQFGLRFTW
jgi:hypothetical protein